ncbi:MAG: radical SAM protein [Oligoflexia bacterium]|nr:radical SAM protein [Oligoflexia bacterium]
MQNLASDKSFVLTLQGLHGQRQAIFDTRSNSLTWSDGGALFPESIEARALPPVFAVSPENPGRKSTDLSLIKVQLGMSCNMRCGYCSQGELRPAKQVMKPAVEEAEGFLRGMSEWYAGGRNGKGLGTRIEFWGGETLLYWPTAKLLATALRERYPDVSLLLFTNGTLVNEEVIEVASRLKVHMAVSYDGPDQKGARGTDPLLSPRTGPLLKKLFLALNPLGLISFNATVSARNHSLVAIQNDIAGKLGVPFHHIRLTYELVMSYNQGGNPFLFRRGDSSLRVSLIRDVLENGANGLLAGGIHLQLEDFRSILMRRMPAHALPQHCGMDQPHQIAVDLKGRVVTCQNTVAEDGHHLGNTSDLQAVRLNTAYHWSNRPECPSCPVVSFCRGSCMFLTGEFWRQSCQQFFEWYLGLFALVLYFQTGMLLQKIEGLRIRGREDRETVLSPSEIQELLRGVGAGASPPIEAHSR